MIKKLYISLFTILLFLPIESAFSDSRCENESISDEKIISYIRYLASDELKGRMSGTPGAEKAAKYISSQFENTGLKALGDNDSYYQKFSFTKGIELGPQNSFEVVVDKSKIEFKSGKDFNTLSFSSSGEVDEELVFAGYGISAPDLEYDDYQGLDVKDKVVLVLRYTPEGYEAESPFYDFAALRYKALNAREKGAKAIIFITPYSQEEELDLTSIGIDYSYSDSGIQSLIMRRDKAEELFLNTGKTLKNLEEKLAKKENSSFIFANTSVKIKTEVIEEQGQSANVIGLIEG